MAGDFGNEPLCGADPNPHQVIGPTRGQALLELTARGRHALRHPGVTQQTQQDIERFSQGQQQIDPAREIRPAPHRVELLPGVIGGQVKLASTARDDGAAKVIVLMEHVARDGSAKIVNSCSLPLTGTKVVHMIVTELAVIDVTPKGLVLREMASDTTIDAVKKATGATLLMEEEPGRF